MSTYAEIVFMVHDEMKRLSDDATYTDRHIRFLADKYRAQLLKKEYTNPAKMPNKENFQAVLLDCELKANIEGLGCETGFTVTSDAELPNYLEAIKPVAMSVAGFNMNSNFTFVDCSRFPYVGSNRYLRDAVYVTINQDHKLAAKSKNEQFKQLRKIMLYAVFTDPIAAYRINDEETDENDFIFPLEAALVPACINFVVRELTNGATLKNDDINDSRDSGPDAQNEMSPQTRRANVVPNPSQVAE